MWPARRGSTRGGAREGGARRPPVGDRMGLARGREGRGGMGWDGMGWVDGVRSRSTIQGHIL